MYGQQRLRSTWASVQSDQSHPFLGGTFESKQVIQQRVKALIRLSRHVGGSESSLVAHSQKSISMWQISRSAVNYMRAVSRENVSSCKPRNDTNQPLCISIVCFFTVCLSSHTSPSEGSDQITQMLRLICNFPGHIHHKALFLKVWHIISLSYNQNFMLLSEAFSCTSLCVCEQ